MNEKMPQDVEQKEKEERYAVGTEVIGLPGSDLVHVRGRVIDFIDKPGHLAYGRYQIEITDEGARKVFGETAWVKPEEIARVDSITLDQLKNLAPGTRVKTARGEIGIVSEKKHKEYPEDLIVVEMEDGTEFGMNSTAEVEVLDSRS